MKALRWSHILAVTIVLALMLGACGGAAETATQAPPVETAVVPTIAVEAPTEAATMAATEAPTAAATEAPDSKWEYQSCRHLQRRP